MSKGKKVPFYQRIAEVIKVTDFELDNDENGYPTIHYVIADYMLKDLSTYDKHRLLDNYAGRVKNLLGKAISYLHDCGIEVYVSIPSGTRNITFITINSLNAEAVERDEKRCCNYAAKFLQGAMDHLESKHPRAFERISGSCEAARKQLLPANTD